MTSTDSVQDLKYKVEDALEVPPEKQSLRLRDKELQDEQTLDEAGVTNEAIVILIIKEPTPPPPPSVYEVKQGIVCVDL